MSILIMSIQHYSGDSSQDRIKIIKIKTNKKRIQIRKEKRKLNSTCRYDVMTQHLEKPNM